MQTFFASVIRRRALTPEVREIELRLDELVTITNSGGLSLTGLTLGAITYTGGTSGWLVASLNATSEKL